MEAYEDDGSQGLLLLDTERAYLMVPTQTRFRGPASSHHWVCSFEAGGYKPTPQDILSAPFYPDPFRRILALSMGPGWGHHVMKVETLLRFAIERAGEEVQWEEWKPCLIEASPRGTPDAACYLGSWVSGFRFFSAFIGLGDCQYDLRVHDFSPLAMKNFLHLADDGCKVMHPSVAAVRLPQYETGIHRVGFGHDSMVVELVSQLSPSRQLMAHLCATHYYLVPCPRGDVANITMGNL